MAAILEEPPIRPDVLQTEHSLAVNDVARASRNEGHRLAIVDRDGT